MTGQHQYEALKLAISDAIFGKSMDTVDDLMELVTAYAATVEREAVEAKEKEWLKTYLTMLLEAYKGVRPARPEDLTISQWYGLVEGIDVGISEVEKSLAALQGPQDGDGK